jgi:hypothetical protein
LEQKEASLLSQRGEESSLQPISSRETYPVCLERKKVVTYSHYAQGIACPTGSQSGETSLDNNPVKIEAKR